MRKLFSGTGLLIKLLSEQQEVKVPKEEQDSGQWKNESSTAEKREARGEQAAEESREVRTAPDVRGLGIQPVSTRRGSTQARRPGAPSLNLVLAT